MTNWKEVETYSGFLHCCQIIKLRRRVFSVNHKTISREWKAISGCLNCENYVIQSPRKPKVITKYFVLIFRPLFRMKSDCCVFFSAVMVGSLFVYSSYSEVSLGYLWRFVSSFSKRTFKTLKLKILSCGLI